MTKLAKTGDRRNGLESARALYGGIRPRRRDRQGELVDDDDAPAIRGESPPAIDRSAVVESWRTIWRAVIRDLTPLQRRALELELEAAADG